MTSTTNINTLKNPPLGGGGAVSVIGAGTMGNGIAHVFAQSGFKVNLVDVNPSQLQRALDTINKNLDRQLSKGTITEDQKNQHWQIFQFHLSLPKVLKKQRL